MGTKRWKYGSTEIGENWGYRSNNYEFERKIEEELGKLGYTIDAHRFYIYKVEFVISKDGYAYHTSFTLRKFNERDISNGMFVYTPHDIANLVDIRFKSAINEFCDEFSGDLDDVYNLVGAICKVPNVSVDGV